MSTMKQPSRGPVQLERRGTIGARAPMKPVAWSHQNELKANRGKTIILVHTTGEVETGILKEADQFAIQVLLVVGNDQSLVTFYKHDLSSYRFPEA